MSLSEINQGAFMNDVTQQEEAAFSERRDWSQIEYFHDIF